MAWEASGDMAREFCEAKQIVEAKLAQQLYAAFNKGEALSNLQKLARCCAQPMWEGQESTFQAALQEEGSLRVWEKISRAQTSIREFFDGPRVEELDATDVADIIRIFGCWVEHGGFSHDAFKGPGQDAWGTVGSEFTETSAMKDAYRSGAPGKGVWNKKEVEDVWGDRKPGRFKDVGVARRHREGGRAIEDHIKRYMRDPSSFSGMGGSPNKPAVGKRAGGDSNILKIDHIFGLIVGADISGTTTDTVFALETLGAGFLTAAYYMLPLATIVHNNHHALIEVALALSINGVLDYEIGFYSTLIPKSSKNSIGSEVPGIKEALNQAEKALGNRQFLVYYSNRQVGGAFVFNPGEAETLRRKKFFHATRWLRIAPGLHLCPTKEQVRDLAAEFVRL